MVEIKRCEWCSMEFDYGGPNIHYCSLSCRDEAKKLRDKRRKEELKGHNGFKSGSTPFDKAYDAYMKETGGKVSFGIWSASRGGVK